LPLDKVYFRAFTEPQLIRPINDFIAKTNYDNYLIISDDGIVPDGTYELVAELLTKYESATGYCCMAQDSKFVNLSRTPLRLGSAIGRRGYCAASVDDYSLYHLDEIKRFRDPVFITWFGGWALTGFRREIWLKHPFRVMPTGGQSDFAVCRSYNAPLRTHKDAYIEHLKENMYKENQMNRLIGTIPPEVRYERFVPGISNLGETQAVATPSNAVQLVWS
jgi:hypothetical protein